MGQVHRNKSAFSVITIENPNNTTRLPREWVVWFCEQLKLSFKCVHQHLHTYVDYQLLLGYKTYRALFENSESEVPITYSQFLAGLSGSTILARTFKCIGENTFQVFHEIQTCSDRWYSWAKEHQICFNEKQITVVITN